MKSGSLFSFPQKGLIWLLELRVCALRIWWWWWWWENFKKKGNNLSQVILGKDVEPHSILNL
jgi:hypothetical protein